MKRLIFAAILLSATVACDEELDSSEPDTQVDVGTDVAEGDTAAEPEDVVEDVPEADATADVEVDAEPDAEPDVEVDAEPDAEPDADVTPTPDADASPDADPDAEQDVEPDVPLTPPEDCVGPTPEVDHEVSSTGEVLECPTCLESTTPNWTLYDFQPLSCGAGSHYGLDQFEGRPTMVVLLSAGCSYCLGQTVKLEEMWWELQGAEHEFNFVVVNLRTMADRASNLTDRGSFAMFQDTDDVNAWGLHGGGKDDFYFYDADGILRAYYPALGSVETTLSDELGYANVRDAMLYLLGEDVVLPGDGDGTIPEEPEEAP